MNQLSMWIAGQPISQGSINGWSQVGTNRVTITDSHSDQLKPYRRRIADTAEVAMRSFAWPRKTSLPIRTSYTFFLPMPKSRPSAIRRAGISYCTVKPDLDKLARAVNDALTIAEVYVDDSQIVMDAHTMYEVFDHDLVGVEIILQTIDVDQETYRAKMSDALQRRLEFAERTSAGS